jgi:hypothetical protein
MSLGFCPQYYEPDYGPTFERRRAQLQLVGESYVPPDAWLRSYWPDEPVQIYWPEYDSSIKSIYYWPCRPRQKAPALPGLRLVDNLYVAELAPPAYEPERAFLYGLTYLEMAAERMDEDDDIDGHIVQLEQFVTEIAKRRSRRRVSLRLI